MKLIKILLFVSILQYLLYGQEIKKYSPQELNDLPTIGTVERWRNTKNVNNLLIEDINNDGVKEFLTLRSSESRSEIIIYTSSRLYYDVQTIYYKLLAFTTIDINEDKIPELLTFGMKNNFTAYLYLYSLKNKKIELIKSKKIFKGVDVNQDGIWDLYSGGAAFIKIPSKNKKVLLRVSGGYDYYSRGIYQVNVPELQIDWKFELGSNPANVLINNVENKEDEMEILVSTNAPENNYTMNSIPDSLSFLIKLSADGVLKEKMVKGKSLARSRINKLYADSVHYLLLFQKENSSNNRFRNNYIQLLNPFSLVTEQEFITVNSYEQVRAPRFLNKFYLNPNDLFISYLDRFLIKFSASPKTGERYYFNKKIKYSFIGDLNGDNLPEYILFFSGDPKVIITDKDLNLLGKQNLSYGGNLTILQNYKLKECNIYFTNQHLFQWTIPFSMLKTQPAFIVFFKKYRDSLLYGLIYMIAILAVIFLIINIVVKSKQLHISERLYNFFIHNYSTAILILNEEKRIEDANKLFCSFLNMSSDELLKIHISKLNELFVSTHFSDKIINMIENNTSADSDRELLLTTSYGLKKVLVNVNRVKLFKKRVLYVVEFVDLSEITHSEQLAAWGSITQKMAHEIKNPLTTILLSLRQIQRKIKKSNKQIAEETNNYIEVAADEIERLRNSTNIFMKFTSTIKTNASLLDVNFLIKEITRTFMYPGSIKLQFNLTPNLPQIKIDEQQLRQVLLNLLENGVDAIDGEGEITVTTESVQKVNPQSGKLNSFIQIEILDTGKGIADEYIEQIFEANFTTKTTGSGFGLAISKFIIDQNNGSIKVKSKESFGTSIAVLLPVAQKQESRNSGYNQ